MLLVAQVQAVVSMAEVFEMLIAYRLRLNVIGSGVLTAAHHIDWRVFVLRVDRENLIQPIDSVLVARCLLLLMVKASLWFLNHFMTTNYF